MVSLLKDKLFNKLYFLALRLVQVPMRRVERILWLHHGLVMYLKHPSMKEAAESYGHCPIHYVY